MINASLHVMLIGWLGTREQVLADAAGKSPAVRRWKQIQVRSDLWVQRNLAPVDHPATGIRIGNESCAADTKPFNESLISEEVKRLIVLNRSAQCRSKLISLERRNGLVLWVEKIFRIERRVAQEFEGRSVDTIFTGSRHGIDHTARGSSEFGRIRIGQNLEFEY